MIAVVERMDIFVTGIASAGCVATGASHKCQTGGNSRWAPSSDRFGLRGAERERPLLIFVTVSNGHIGAVDDRQVWSNSIRGKPERPLPDVQS